MSEHEDLRLRVITVSTRAALGSGLDPVRAAAIRARADELLDDLERDVLSDGADRQLLGRIGAARIALGEATADDARAEQSADADEGS